MAVTTNANSRSSSESSMSDYDLSKMQKMHRRLQTIFMAHTIVGCIVYSVEFNYWVCNKIELNDYTILLCLSNKQ
ncbi:hypothetical protein DERF_014536 [Dermatophagoides farinae]|uniref:Uncharacterized protein n=1 Tax=Dermatophagoides farinae TaxID=6954 RepID=A0A922HN38_DERFA|nr:hypothetical protein DERF_014536 [Dermatophagoides farinae]